MSMAFSLPSTVNPCSGDSPEDLRCKLICTSMELQKVQAEGRLQDTELWRLQELLNIMTKERDEAREECRRLQEFMTFQQQGPAMGVDSASSFMYSSSMVSSPSSSPWSLQELEEHLNSDDFCPTVGAPSPFELQQALESLVQSCGNGQSIKPANEGEIVRNSHHQEMYRSALDQSLCFDGHPCLNLHNSLVKEESVSTGSASVRSLSRQSSSNSSSACVQRFLGGQVSMDSLDEMEALSSGGAAKLAPTVRMTSSVCTVSPSRSSMGCNVSRKAKSNLPLQTLTGGKAAPIGYDSTVSDNASFVANHGLPPTPVECNSGISVAVDVSRQMLCMGNDMLPKASIAPCSLPGNAESVELVSRPFMSSNPPSITSHGCPIATGCMVKSVAYPTPCITKKATMSAINSQALATSAPLATALSSGPVPMSAVSSTYSQQQASSTQLRQFHLPEPPEADPQVMLNSLPEKGKLLQAVLQAGPLLQTLLLGGPLPQWRYPPPALSTRDIPKVSLTPGHVLSTPAAVQGNVGGRSAPPSTITRKRIAFVEPGSQNKKLRKLSPLLTKKSQAMHASSGGSERQELAVG